MDLHTGPHAPKLETDSIAAHLEGLEETIISKLIDRVQFCINDRIYRPGESGFEGEKRQSLFHLRLLFQEKMDARFGRFCVPEERPFNHRLPREQRRVALPPTGLHIGNLNAVNLMRDIVTRYQELVTAICRNGDDGQYGSSVEHDVYAVQAISRRIHYGSLYVAESKFREREAHYTALVAARPEKEDAIAAITEQLTRAEVEDKILNRVRDKVAAAQVNVNTKVRMLVDPNTVADFFKSAIIPLTKRGEALYMLQRSID